MATCKFENIYSSRKLTSVSTRDVWNPSFQLNLVLPFNEKKKVNDYKFFSD